MLAKRAASSPPMLTRRHVRSETQCCEPPEGVAISTARTTLSDCRKARPDEAASISEVLAAAFFDDPVFRWMLPDDDHRATANRTFFRLTVDLLAGHDDAWTTADGADGAALWVPHGREVMSDEQAERFAAETAELAGPYADRMTELFTLLDEHHPHEPHEYLFFIGVRPGAQGRGIGGALLAPVLARADAAGHPCYLEASSLRSRELYERHGFRATAEIAPAGGAPLWPMVRDPQ